MVSIEVDNRIRSEIVVVVPQVFHHVPIYESLHVLGTGLNVEQGDPSKDHYLRFAVRQSLA